MLEPRPTSDSRAGSKPPVLRLVDVTKEFKVRGGTVQALSGLSFDVNESEVFGLVGESGCGKSTSMRVALQVERPTAGEVWFRGERLDTARRDALRRMRRDMQMVFQDPYSSLNPRWRVRNLVSEPLRIHRVGTKDEQTGRALELLDLVGLDPQRFGSRRIGELSGGQCQRVAIARALALSPDLLIFDEAVSSLDVSIQAQVLNLFSRLRRELSLTAVFIAHDLAVVKHVSDRVGVMYLGRMCEIASATALYETPAHPYTAALIAAIPRISTTGPVPITSTLEGDLPSPTEPPSGCRFRTRCPNAQDRCAADVPQLTEIAPGHVVACHFPLQIGYPNNGTRSAHGGHESSGPHVATLGARPGVRGS